MRAARSNLVFLSVAVVSVLAFTSPATALSPGTQLWVARTDAGADGFDAAEHVATSPDGARVFVTGRVNAETANEAWLTLAYAAGTGAELWRATDPDGMVTPYAGPAALGVSPDGSKVFVTGQDTAGQFHTIAYNAATGAVLWTAGYPDQTAFASQAYDLVVAPDGSKVFVTGEVNYTDYATVAYDAGSAQVVWATVHTGGTTANAIAVNPAGTRVFVTGASGRYETGRSDYLTIAYKAATGSKVWGSKFNGPAQSYSYDQALDVAVSPNGRQVFVTGNVSGNGGDYDIATVGYSAGTGAEQWHQRRAGFGALDDPSDFGYAVGVSPDSKTVYVAGFSNGLIVLAYGASKGSSRWTYSYPLTCDPGACITDTSTAYALAVGPDGQSVYAAGWVADKPANGPWDYNYLTVAVNAQTGVLAWDQRYDGPGEPGSGQDSYDTAWSIALSPNGSWLFVAGQSDGGASGFDYATVGYAA